MDFDRWHHGGHASESSCHFYLTSETYTHTARHLDGQRRMGVLFFTIVQLLKIPSRGSEPKHIQSLNRNSSQIEIQRTALLSGCFTKLRPLTHRLMRNLKHLTRAVRL
jgi:hypothetical protein